MATLALNLAEIIRRFHFIGLACYRINVQACSMVLFLVSFTNNHFKFQTKNVLTKNH